MSLMPFAIGRAHVQLQGRRLFLLSFPSCLGTHLGAKSVDAAVSAGAIAIYDKYFDGKENHEQVERIKHTIGGVLAAAHC
jgi:hypothetical protein